MWYFIIGVSGLLIGFAIGFVLCGVIASGKCSDCRLKEIKDFEGE